jgi:hypothetical protein
MPAMPSRALRRGAVALLALVALVGVLGLSIPHGHAGPAEERSCPACHVTRSGGGSVPEAAGVVVPPDETPGPEPSVRSLAAPSRIQDALLPSRGPPPVSSVELP